MDEKKRTPTKDAIDAYIDASRKAEARTAGLAGIKASREARKTATSADDLIPHRRPASEEPILPSAAQWREIALAWEKVEEAAISASAGAYYAARAIDAAGGAR